MYLILGNTEKYTVPILKSPHSLSLVSWQYVLLLQLSVCFTETCNSDIRNNLGNMLNIWQQV
jgi:hypothetical protein